MPGTLKSQENTLSWQPRKFAYCCAFILSFAQNTFFKQRLFYSRSFQKYSRTSVENFQDFSRISHNFSIFKDSSSTWCFFKDLSRPVRTMLSAALTAWPRSQGLLVSQYGGRREDKRRPSSLGLPPINWKNERRPWGRGCLTTVSSCLFILSW